MLRKQIRNQAYRQLRKELVEIGTMEDRQAKKRAREAALMKVVDFGNKAKEAKEIVDIFLDGAEDLTLKAINETSDPEKLLQIKMYYKACLMLEKEISTMINEAMIKRKTLEELKNRKGE